MSARSASRSAKSPSVADEVVVELGQDLLAELLELDREVGRPCRPARSRVVVREGDVELGRAADLEPERLASKPGIRRSWPRISGIRSDVPPSNGSPSRVPTNEMTA